jgi:hypothetical protein
MRRFIWIYPCLFLMITGCSSTPPAQTEPSNPASISNQSGFLLLISEPAQDAKVGQELPMKGTAPAGQRVWLIVHPQGTPDYWVQPPASANGEGQWQNVVYIGRAGQGDIGQRYEIRAIATPKTPLKEGKVLKAWPEAQVQSDVLKVKRQ